jgi:hypothetical protein
MGSLLAHVEDRIQGGVEHAFHRLRFCLRQRESPHGRNSQQVRRAVPVPRCHRGAATREHLMLGCLRCADLGPLWPTFRRHRPIATRRSTFKPHPSVALPCIDPLVLQLPPSCLPELHRHRIKRRSHTSGVREEQASLAMCVRGQAESTVPAPERKSLTRYPRLAYIPK